MDKQPDGIIPAAQREGMTDRLLPASGWATGVSPAPDLARRRVATSVWLALRWMHLITFLTLSHLLASIVPLELERAGCDGPLLTAAFRALYFPLLLYNATGGWFFPVEAPLTASPLTMFANSAAWVASVYGLFLAGRGAGATRRPSATPRSRASRTWSTSAARNPRPRRCRATSSSS
jgi:hypothetical protein